MSRRAYLIPGLSALTMSLTACTAPVVSDWSGVSVLRDGSTAELPYTYSIGNYDFEFQFHLRADRDGTGTSIVQLSTNDSQQIRTYDIVWESTESKSYHISDGDPDGVDMSCTLPEKDVLECTNPLEEDSILTLGPASESLDTLIANTDDGDDTGT